LIVEEKLNSYRQKILREAGILRYLAIILKNLFSSFAPQVNGGRSREDSSSVSSSFKRNTSELERLNSSNLLEIPKFKSQMSF
jgi:hypothetical protein